jgi:hypothetical protein
MKSEAVLAVAAGITVVVLGCMTQLVGTSDLHGSLVFIGAALILCGGLKLTT